MLGSKTEFLFRPKGRKQDDLCEGLSAMRVPQVLLEIVGPGERHTFGVYRTWYSWTLVEYSEIGVVIRKEKPHSLAYAP